MKRIMMTKLIEDVAYDERAGTLEVESRGL